MEISTSVGRMQEIGNQRTVQAEKVQLLDEMHRRQESYMRREDKLRTRVEELQAELDQLKTARGVSCHDANKEYVTPSWHSHAAQRPVQTRVRCRSLQHPPDDSIPLDAGYRVLCPAVAPFLWRSQIVYISISHYICSAQHVI